MLDIYFGIHICILIISIATECPITTLCNQRAVRRKMRNDFPGAELRMPSFPSQLARHERARSASVASTGELSSRRSTRATSMQSTSDTSELADLSLRSEN